ncbi:Fic family protein [Candidatus Saccharibacteria bacterium]|nr:Fic family protein [Candidatus Saccharibacteria bacterium]
MTKKSVIHHHPKYLPVKLDYGIFARELAEAQYAIGLLQGSQKTLHNALHLIGPLVAKEAEVSSKIEGTQSTSKDVFVYAAGGRAMHTDTPVVSNYRSAMYDAIFAIQARKKITKHLMMSLHSKLLKGVRYKGKLGAFRGDDVWIAEREGDPIEKALYVPPEHIHITSYIDNLIKYVDEKDEINLVKAGVVHYQFEAVHPFEDGNGRIGRLLIPLILYYKGELSLPIVYSSGYFEARADQYRDALRKTDTTGKYEPWLKFFLSAISEQAKETLVLVDKIRDLNSLLKKKYENSKSPYILRLIDLLFESPVISPPEIMKRLGIPSRMTALRLVEQLQSDKVLFEVGQKGSGGTSLYAFAELLDIIS